MARGGDNIRSTPMGGEEAYEQDAEAETQKKRDKEESGDCHMTPASDVESKNFYTALDRDATKTVTDVSEARPSVAPSIKSPH